MMWMRLTAQCHVPELKGGRRRYLAALAFAALVTGGVSGWLVAGADAPSTRQAPATAPAREARKKNPIPNDAGSRATGKKIYAANCDQCHGPEGKGNGPTAAKLDTTPANLTDPKYGQATDGTLYWLISNGHRPMPHFDNTLPEEARWNVINYLRTLMATPATTSASQPSTPTK